MLYPVTVIVRLWILVRGWLNVVLTVLHNRSQNLSTNMCLHHPHFLIFLSFKCNIVVIKIKFKFTDSKGWQLVSVIEIFQVSHCIFVSSFLHASCLYLLTAYLFSFQCQLDAQYSLQQAFLKQCIFRKLFDCLFIPCLELTLLKHLFYLSSRLIIIRFAATRWSFRTW